MASNNKNVTSLPSTSKSLQYYMRLTHRILGYLTVGLVMVYSLSGITLIYRTGDFMKKGEHVEQMIESDMSPSDLGAFLKMKNFKVTDESDQTIYFADGQYDKVTGKLSYVKKEVVAPIDKFIDLHKMPQAKSPSLTVITTIFGIILFLLALTSLFMYKPKAKQFKSNIALTMAGVVIAVILLLLV